MDWPGVVLFYGVAAPLRGNHGDERNPQETADSSQRAKLLVVFTLIASVAAVVGCLWFRNNVTCPSRQLTCSKTSCPDLLACFKRLRCSACPQCPSLERADSCRCPSVKCQNCCACAGCFKCCGLANCPVRCLKCPKCCSKGSASTSSGETKTERPVSRPGSSFRDRRNVDSGGYSIVSLSPDVEDTKFCIPLPTEYSHLGVDRPKSLSPVSFTAPSKAYDHVMLKRTGSAPAKSKPDTDSEYRACASVTPPSVSAYDVTVIDARSNRVHVIGEVYDNLKKAIPLHDHGRGTI